jgi:SAM-dependent methyltransferase
MTPDKPECMKVARLFERDFWDGDRKYGYGGYKYDGRQKVLAEKLIKQYNLTNKSSILDYGCGKGYLLYELKKLLPKCKIYGLDISQYAFDNAQKEIKKELGVDNVLKRNEGFDLIVSVNTLHNMELFDLTEALRFISSTSNNSYIVVESFRNEKELCNLQCWALTCRAWFSPQEWNLLFSMSGYKGDYEFIYFE